ncbi:hypothetical protein [Pelomicrobium methylotrophicum]|uniref:hypothetical protein n=1 Tax=Pelomicrobium methylotrophicum TaxID=2602750 RepID=UPI001969FE1B|nr:hypothetical protein [Pelomicrobium methylotrophicum]
MGTLLNLINQGEALRQGHAFDWPHGQLNHLVPFPVASYSTGRRGLEDEQRQQEE